MVHIINDGDLGFRECADRIEDLDLQAGDSAILTQPIHYGLRFPNDENVRKDFIRYLYLALPPHKYEISTEDLPSGQVRVTARAREKGN